MRTTLYIGGWRLDQFGDEAATVVSSVLDITDITKNTGDYTKTFTVPASKRNNILFKHWYDADIDNGFDARLKVDGRIELDGLPFKDGLWRLSKVSIKKNEPSSYTINFFGKLPSLKDIVKKDLLSDLDLSAYNHDYDSDTVKEGLTVGLFDKDVIYNLFAKKQYYYNSDPSDNTQLPTIANIAGDGGVDTGVIWNDLHPSLRLLSIIEAIEERYNGKQKTTLNVRVATVTGIGSCLLILNNIQYTIPIFTTTTEGNALELRNYVNALPEYTAEVNTSNAAIVDIEAVEIGSQVNTIWEVGTSTSMDVLVTTTIKGSNGLRFTRDFFETSEFTNLYMWLNPSADKEPGGETNFIDWDGGDSPWMNIVTDVGSYEVINDLNPVIGRSFSFTCEITPDVDYEDVVYSIISIKDGEVLTSTEGLFGEGLQFSEIFPEGVGDGVTHLMQWQVQSSQEFKYSANLVQRQRSASGSTEIQVKNTSSSANTNESIFVLNEEMPKLKILDFLKGLFNMFKLVVVPQDNGDYFVDTINSYYADGSLYDITKYVDFESYDVNRGEILNEIELKFKEPTTILNIQFEKNNQRGYGDIEKTLTDDAGELLDGESLTFELPFEQFVYERLPDLNTGVVTNVQYAAIIDEELEPASPSAHIFYGLYTGVNTSPIGFITDTGVRIQLNVNLWTAFHQYPHTQPNYASIFNNEFSEWDGNALNNNLYSRHYNDYIEAIFNIKKRTFNYEAILPLHIITKLKLNDVLKIKENFYRIDKYTYNLLTGKTILNLINSFDNEIDASGSQDDNVFVDYREQTVVISIGETISKPSPIDQGYGIDWVTLSTPDKNVSITFDEFSTETGDNRVMFLEYVNTNGTQYIFLSQSDKGYVPSYIFNDPRNSQYIQIVF